MYQQKGSSILKGYDLITEAAAEMAEENQIVRANFYRERVWKRNDPRRLAALAEARKRSAQLLPYSLSTMVLSSSNSRPDDAVPLTVQNLRDEQPIHSNSPCRSNPAGYSLRLAWEAQRIATSLA